MGAVECRYGYRKLAPAYLEPPVVQVNSLKSTVLKEISDKILYEPLSTAYRNWERSSLSQRSPSVVDDVVETNKVKSKAGEF